MIREVPEALAGYPGCGYSGVSTYVGATTADDSLFNGTSPPESFTPAMGQNRLTIDFVTSIAVADKRRGFKWLALACPSTHEAPTG